MCYGMDVRPMNFRVFPVLLFIAALLVQGAAGVLAGSLPPCGRVASLSGEQVEYKPRGGAFWTGLKIFQELHHGEAVRTGVSSRVELALIQGITVRMETGSVIEIFPAEKEMRSRVTRVRVPAGSLWFQVKPLPKGVSFVVDTPEVSVGVRGTVFVVSRTESSGTTVTVLKGAVMVWDRVKRRSKLLREGYEVVHPPGGEKAAARKFVIGVREIRWRDDVWSAGDALLTRAAEQEWFQKFHGREPSPRLELSPYGLLHSNFHYAPGIPGASDQELYGHMRMIEDSYLFLKEEADEMEDRFDGFIEDQEESLRGIEISD